MSRRKLCFSTILATIVALAAVARLNRHLPEFCMTGKGTSSTRAVRRVESAAASSRWGNAIRRTELFPTLLPVQSKNTKYLAAGKLLVASRELGDPNFAQTVVLLVHYDVQGVLGLILNRRTDIPLSQVLDDVKGAKNRSDPVYLGGPVELPSVFALFKSPAKVEGAEQVFGGVYLISAKPLFEQTISSRPDPGVFHVYLGYAGWTKEQLQKEVELGAWFIFPADATTVFNSDPDSLWPQMIRKTELKLAQTKPADHDPGQDSRRDSAEEKPSHQPGTGL